MTARVLVLYDSHGPQMEELADAIVEGVVGVDGVVISQKRIEEAVGGDLIVADGIILGSPNWSGVTGFMKRWLDDQGDMWKERNLSGKVGAAFATGRGRHSGLEFTLLSLLHWMLACGMFVVGLPFTERMDMSGSYYGATAAGIVQPEDKEQARALGRRVAQTCLKLRL